MGEGVEGGRGHQGAAGLVEDHDVDAAGVVLVNLRFLNASVHYFWFVTQCKFTVELLTVTLTPCLLDRASMIRAESAAIASGFEGWIAALLEGTALD